MIKPFKKTIALCVTLAFIALLPVQALPAPRAAAAGQDENPARPYVEKEQRAGFQYSGSRQVLPILLGIAGATAGLFLLVMLVSKEKYDITGNWRFRNTWITPGQVDFDSDWVFTSGDIQIKTMGSYVRYESDGSFQTGEYTVVNKKEVVFLGDGVTEQYTGQFDSKTTMSGEFMLADGKKGTWTATKK